MRNEKWNCVSQRRHKPPPTAAAAHLELVRFVAVRLVSAHALREVVGFRPEGAAHGPRPALPALPASSALPRQQRQLAREVLEAGRPLAAVSRPLPARQGLVGGQRAVVEGAPAGGGVGGGGGGGEGAGGVEERRVGGGRRQLRAAGVHAGGPGGARDGEVGVGGEGPRALAAPHHAPAPGQHVQAVPRAAEEAGGGQGGGHVLVLRGEVVQGGALAHALLVVLVVLVLQAAHALEGGVGGQLALAALAHPLHLEPAA